MRRLMSLAKSALSPGSVRTTRVAHTSTAVLPLYDIYEDTFELVRADTDELRNAVYRLRYQVYCMERPFENPADHPNGLETDNYDKNSVHTLLIHRKSGMLVGNVRLVLPNPDDLLHSFPMQELCSHPKLGNPHRLRSACEVSRFCVSRDFRKREEDGFYTGVFLPGRAISFSLFKKHDQRRVIPFTPLGLIRAVFEMAMDHDIVFGYAVLEPTLIRLLRKLGVELGILGPAVSYHGTRYPLEMDPLKIWRSVENKHPEIWKVLTKNGTLVARMEALVAKRGEKSTMSIARYGRAT